MPLNERCLKSKFHYYDVKSASACAMLVEAAAARPHNRPLCWPIAATSVFLSVENVAKSPAYRLFMEKCFLAQSLIKG